MSTITRTITRIDASYEADASAVIDLVGRTMHGTAIDLWLINTGDGPAVWPGASNLTPYGSVPLLKSVKDLQSA